MKKSVDLYKLGLFWLMYISGIVIVTSILLLCGISIGYLNMTVPLIITVIYFFYDNQKLENTVPLVLIAILILIGLVVFSGSVYDVTWDGAAYHKQAVGMLKEGWNPVYLQDTIFNSFRNSVLNVDSQPFLWAEVYPKSTWYFAASLYYIFGNIEVGKAYTLIFMFIVFCLVYDFISEFRNKKSEKIILALILALNPIAMAQVNSYYLDGCATCVLILLMMYLPTLTMEEYHRNKKERYLIVFMLIIWGCNLKFSILFFTATYCVIILIINMIKKRKDSVKLFSFFALSAAFSIIIVGFAPYITNIFRFKNPFYGFVGESSWMTEERIWDEFGIAGGNNTSRFIISLFGKMSHGNYHTISEVLKIPFSVSVDELKYYGYVDTRIGGFGIWSGGIFIVSIISLIYLIGFRRKQLHVNKQWFFLFSVIVIISICEMLVLPGTYSARYIGQLWVLPFFSSWLWMDYIKNRKQYIVPIIIFILCIVNNCWWGGVTLYKIYEGNCTTATLNSMGETGKHYDVAFFSSAFNGIQYNLKDHGIDFDVYNADILSGDDIRTTYSNWMYYQEK